VGRLLLLLLLLLLRAVMLAALVRSSLFISKVAVYFVKASLFIVELQWLGAGAE